MAEKEYIEREAVLESISGLTWYSKNKKGVLNIGAVNRKEAYYPAGNVFDAVESVPAADVVLRAAYEQMKRERDIAMQHLNDAMQQLNDAGIPFCGKMGGKRDEFFDRHLGKPVGECMCKEERLISKEEEK